MDCWAVTETSVRPQRWPPDGNTVVAPPPVVAPSPVDEVPLNVADNTMRLNVIVGGRSLTMVLDTGATHGSVPTSFGEKLLADGSAVEGPQTTVTLADNTTHKSRTIMVKSLTIGSHTVHDVRFGLEADDAEPLLGFGALSAFGKFSIDAERGVLTFS
jgi:predicted aspartyl protease